MTISNQSMLQQTCAIAAVMALCATQMIAQTASTVTINFDDGEGITGDIVESSETSIKLDTIMGVVTIPMEGVTCIGTACPDAIRLVIEDAPVRLVALDSSAWISGNFIEIDDAQYVLATETGEVRIDTAKVTCEGAGCPETADAFVFGGPVSLTNGSTTIDGKLFGLEADSYLIESETFGELRVSRDFSCTGDGCPQG